MLTEESKKKLGLIILIACAVLGGLFIFFAVVINRGTLTVVAQAPYNVDIWNLMTVPCNENSCSITLAPGEYSVTVTRPGHIDEKFGAIVPILGEDKHELKLKFLPQLQEITSESPDTIFPENKINDSTLGVKKIFLDQGGKYLAYFDFDPVRKLQLLYIQPNEENGSASKKSVTSFLRSLENYSVFPDIEGRKKIAVVEQTAAEAVLYLIDIEGKTKNSLFSYPVIRDVMWLKGMNSFLFQARETGDQSGSVFIYNLDSGKADKLDLKTNLQNIVVRDSQTLIAATAQEWGSTGYSGNQAVGVPVTLGELTVDPETSSGTTFVEYNLTSKIARFIASDNINPASKKIIFNEDRSGIYYMSGDKVFELVFNK